MASKDRSGFQTATNPNTSNDSDDDADWIDRPEEGESVQGIILEKTENCGKFDSTLLKLRRTDSDEGERALMWSNNAIDDILNANDLGVGDEIIVEGVGSYQWEDTDGEMRDATSYEVLYR